MHVVVVVVQLLSLVSLCDPFPVFHYLPEFAQTHVRWVGDAIQPSHTLLPPSPPTFHLSQHQGLFQWDSHTGFYLFMVVCLACCFKYKITVFTAREKRQCHCCWNCDPAFGSALELSLEAQVPSTPRDYQITPWKDSPYPGHHLRCWDEQWAAAQLAALILT